MIIHSLNNNQSKTKVMKKFLSVLAIMLAIILTPFNCSAQSRTKRKPSNKTYQKRKPKPTPGKVLLTMYCRTWRNCINGYKNGITEPSPIDCIRMRENNYIEFIRNDGSVWKRFYLPYKNTDIYGELSFCNKEQTIAVCTYFRTEPHVILVTEEDECIFYLDMDKTNADIGVF